MASYQKITVSAKFSDVSSFSPSKDFDPDADNPGSGTYKHAEFEVSAGTSGTTIDLGMFSTVTQLLVKNKDTSNYVDAKVRTTGGGSNDQILRAPAGGILALGSAITVANDLVLTANTAACVCEVCVVGT